MANKSDTGHDDDNDGGRKKEVLTRRKCNRSFTMSLFNTPLTSVVLIIEVGINRFMSVCVCAFVCCIVYTRVRV